MNCLDPAEPLEDWEFLRSDLGGVWEALRPANPGSPEAVPAWKKLSLPHCYNSLDAVDPDEAYYQGPAWYRRGIEPRNPFPEGRTLLFFEGAGQKTDVYLGTKLLGSHVGGYDEWLVDLSEHIPAGGGVLGLCLRCDNSRDLELIPSDLSDFCLYGGLYRPVHLLYRPALAIGDLKIQPQREADGGWLVRVQVELQGKAQAWASLQIQILGPEGQELMEASLELDGGLGPREWSFPIAKGRLWSPERPELYTCLSSLQSPAGTSKAESRFGLRFFEFLKNGPFLLNGERLPLRGTHRHEDHAGVGAALTDELMEREIGQMKAMGVNFLRLGHYQQSRRFLDLCDERGILVWEEIPWCRGGLGGPEYQNQAQRMLATMIGQHFNHPSILAWGLGNENDWPGDFPDFDERAIRAFMGQLNDLAHSLDPSRPTALRRCAFCRDLVDLYSPSIWAGWYRGLYTDYRRVAMEEAGLVDRFIHIEWGGDSHAGRHAELPIQMEAPGGERGMADERLGDAALVGGEARMSRDGDWSESYICDLFDWHLEEQEKMPWLTGTAFWIFKDFATPLRPENPVPYVNQKGVLSRDGRPKEAYYVFQSHWTTEPMAHIYGHSWPIRWGGKDEEKEVKVYSNCPEAELFVNGITAGIRSRRKGDFPASGLRWKAAFREGENHLRVQAREGNRTVVDELSFVYQLGMGGPPSALDFRTPTIALGIAAVELEVRDTQGRVCLGEKGALRFSLAGDGELIDNQGTPWGSRLVQLSNGRAGIRVRLKGGTSHLAATYPGLPTGFCTLSS